MTTATESENGARRPGPEPSPAPRTLALRYDVGDLDIARIAVLIALTAGREAETALRDELNRLVPAVKTAVISIGGQRAELSRRLMTKVVTAALDSGIIPHRSRALHGLVHAVMEMERGLHLDIPGSASLALKIVIASNGQWVVVVGYGVSAFHMLTNHARLGMGVMHL